MRRSGGASRLPALRCARGTRGPATRSLGARRRSCEGRWRAAVLQRSTSRRPGSRSWRRATSAASTPPLCSGAM
eukprot:6916673-Lingulodinium_polyedra.AAC.1